MVSPTPASLRSLDISRFTTRAAQVEKVKPPIAYWCYYWAVNQILGRNLHLQDDESKLFTTELMDKLEQIKELNAKDDAILDDVVGQAYVEQFGNQTLERADKTVQANKASKQTADTYQAAATFLDLVHIWGSPDAEIAAKSKYAKYHALRIVKALKAGEDPNLSNPPPIQEVPTEEPRLAHVQDDELVNRQPSVLDVPDQADSVHPQFESQPIPPPPNADEPSPIIQAKDLDDEHVSSVRDSSSVAPSPLTPEKKLALDSELPDQDFPMTDAVSPPSVPTPSEFYHTTHTPVVRAPAAPFTPPLSRPEAQAPPLPAPVAAQVHNAVAASSALNQSYNIDDNAVIDAQKHAKWAISALNFEDVPTAVNELREALRALGAA